MTNEAAMLAGFAHLDACPTPIMSDATSRETDFFLGRDAEGHYLRCGGCDAKVRM